MRQSISSRSISAATSFWWRWPTRQIAGLSPYAANAALSVVANEAAKFPRLDWNTESVVNLAPDLILVGPSDHPTRAILSATGLRVVEIGLISDLAAARQQARDIGALIGHPERGEALAQALEQAEQKLAAVAFKPPRTASVVQRGGWTEGPQSLVSAMLTVAGLRPPPFAAAGFGGYVSMEQLLVEGPDILVLQDPPREAADQGALFITHPALLAKYGPKRRIECRRATRCVAGQRWCRGWIFCARRSRRSVDRARQHVGPAEGGDTAALQHHDVACKLPHLVGVMADIDHRHAAFVAQPDQVGQDFRLAIFIERAEWFVEQQAGAAYQQRAAQRNALAFAAG